MAGGLKTAAVLGLWIASNAHALGLGELTVQSHLGAPLRAEIRVVDITEAEAATLRAAVATPETFRTAGAEYHPSLTGVTVAVLRRPDGTPVLRLTGTRPVDEAFIDLIVEAATASGRVMRDYTLQLEPRPTARKP